MTNLDTIKAEFIRKLTTTHFTPEELASYEEMLALNNQE